MELDELKSEHAKQVISINSELSILQQKHDADSALNQKIENRYNSNKGGLRQKVSIYFSVVGAILNESRHEKTYFLHTRNKGQISAFVFTTYVFTTKIEKSLYFCNPKFQTSTHLLRLYSPICIIPGWKAQRQVFSRCGTNSCES